MRVSRPARVAVGTVLCSILFIHARFSSNSDASLHQRIARRKLVLSTDPENAVPNQYLVRFHNDSLSLSDVEMMAEEMARLVGGTILRVYHNAMKGAVLANVPHTAKLDALLMNASVSLIEQVRFVCLYKMRFERLCNELMTACLRLI
jgi:hypothetical protein